jgi:hypothetical protein
LENKLHTQVGVTAQYNAANCDSTGPYFLPVPADDGDDIINGSLAVAHIDYYLRMALKYAITPIFFAAIIRNYLFKK